MEINDFLLIGVVGSALSVLFELIKGKMPASTPYRRLAILILSLAVGTAYWAVRGTQYFQTVLGVLAAASTVYALYLKNEA